MRADVQHPAIFLLLHDCRPREEEEHEKKVKEEKRDKERNQNSQDKPPALLDNSGVYSVVFELLAEANAVVRT
jgi:hypothetical protein